MPRFSPTRSPRFVLIVLYFTIYENIRLQAGHVRFPPVRRAAMIPPSGGCLQAGLRLAAGPAQLDTIDPRKTSVIDLKVGRKMHGIGVTADHVGEMPIRHAQHVLPGKHRNVERVSCAHAARALVAIGDAVELEPHFILGYALNRQLDLAKSKGRIVARPLGVKIKRADLAVRARTDLAILWHLRIRPGRRARRQWAERAELAIRIAASQNPLRQP